MAIEPVMSVEVVSRESVVAAESPVRPTERVPAADSRATAEMPTTTAAVPAGTTVRVRRRAAGQDQDSDQCGQPN
jgi:hypothetical protein